MNLELFFASLLGSASFSLMVWFLLNRKMGRKAAGNRGAVDRTGMTETHFADLVSELNHVANSHVNAVEDRRDELKRVIELANGRIRSLSSLLSDLEIIEKRLRGSVAAETVVEDIAPQEYERASTLSRRARLTPQGSAAGEKKEADMPRRELHRQIIQKADEGLSAMAIASTLRVQQNEVEMVLRREKRH